MVDRRWNYIRDENNLHDEIKTMMGYAVNTLEIEKFFIEHVTPSIKGYKLKIFEPCCGIGYLASHLHEISPESEFYCIDQTQEFIDIANTTYSDNGLIYECRDIYDMKDGKPYDISYNFASLMIIPYYDEMIKKMIELTKDQMFVFSLFYEGDIDFQVRVREWKTNAGQKDWNSYMNVYSKPQFERYVKELGATDVHWSNFNIDIPINRKSIDRMGSYTYTLMNGDRVEMSGIVKKNWKLARVSL